MLTRQKENLLRVGVLLRLAVFSEAFLDAHIPLITQLRLSGALKPYLSAKRCLKSSKRHSEVFGMNEWLSQEVMLQLLGLLVQQGGIVSLEE